MQESIFQISSDRVVDEIDRARAQEYALLAILLSRSPDGEMIDRLALLRGDAEAYEGTPSIFVTGWFRATLVLIVLAIVVVITVPWLMDFLDGGAREPRPPVRNEAPPASPNPIPSGR